MNATLAALIALVREQKVLISDHGYDELAADGIFAMQAVDGIFEAEVLEDYPDFAKGPCILVLQKDESGNPVHVVWGIPRGKTEPAVLVTAYRPDPAKWTSDFRRRKT